MIVRVSGVGRSGVGERGAGVPGRCIVWKSVVAVVVSAAVVAGLAGLGSGTARQGVGEPGQPAARVRVGTYDNRAVAVAWARSEYNDVGELYRQLEEAKAAGDRGRVKELTTLGPKRQQRLHYQGFGRTPVTDLLEPVKDRLGEAARAAGVDAIVFECDFAGEGV